MLIDRLEFYLNEPKLNKHLSLIQKINDDECLVKSLWNV